MTTHRIQARQNSIPVIQRAVDFLTALPDGKLLTTAKLAELTGINYNYIHGQAFLIPEEYSYRNGREKKLYGNKNTIKNYAQYKKEQSLHNE